MIHDIQWGKIVDATILGSAITSLTFLDKLYYGGQILVVVLGILWYLRQFYVSFKKD